MSGPWEVFGGDRVSDKKLSDLITGDAAPPGPWAAYAPQPPQRSPVEQGGRVAGQVGQGFNDSVYEAIMALPDASAWLSRQIGLVPPNTAPPSVERDGRGTSSSSLSTTTYTKYPPRSPDLISATATCRTLWVVASRRCRGSGLPAFHHCS